MRIGLMDKNSVEFWITFERMFAARVVYIYYRWEQAWEAEVLTVGYMLANKKFYHWVDDLNCMCYLVWRCARHSACKDSLDIAVRRGFPNSGMSQ